MNDKKRLNSYEDLPLVLDAGFLSVSPLFPLSVNDIIKWSL